MEQGWTRGRQILGFCAAAFVSLGLMSADSAAQGAEPTSKLFIISSFPETVYKRVTQAFEREHPQIRVYVLNRKTPAAVSYIQQKIAEHPDVFWASSPDAFELLKESGDLKRFRYTDPGIPQTLGNYPINDPDGYYTGFAVSGYGMMWNTHYLERNGLKPPTNWDDLTDPAYYRHIGITAPSRSGTTHVIVEGILQQLGWERGWAFLMEMAGNLATVTARSFSVVEGVNSGRFGIGLVIDFLGLSSKATGLPVDFRYFAKTPVLPASVAVLKDAENMKIAETFVRFLLSDEGQRLLFEPEMRRLPIVPSAYREAPPGYPNPFQDGLFAKAINFSSQLSRSRYDLVNALFDALITFRVRRLNRVWSTLHRAEVRLGHDDRPNVRAALQEARRLATQVPVSRTQSMEPRYTSIFVREEPGRAVSEQQARLEQEWDETTTRNLTEALRIAEAQAALFDGGTDTETQP